MTRPAAGKPARAANRRRAVLLGALCLLAGAGCATRERSNPLDPANHETGGLIPGFDATAANGVVELRWTPLSQQGIVAYAIQRWRPGEAPGPLAGAVFKPFITGALDFDVANDSTYVYRLVARFDYGDSAVSPPDSATPGARSIQVLTAEAPSVVGLSPDGRDVISVDAALDAYEDFDLDRSRAVLWLSDPAAGVVLRHTLDGAVAGATLRLTGITDVSVSNLRGVGWLASPSRQVVEAYGPDLNDTSPRLTVAGLGHPRVVEAGTLDPTVWVGTDEGFVYRISPTDGTPIEQWSLGAPVRAIALDQSARTAWVVTARDALSDLYLLAPGDTTVALKRSNLDNVVDVEVEAVTQTLWISERGSPRQGRGRISRFGPDGATLATRTGLEPYGIGVEPGSDHVWVTDLFGDRLLQLDAAASIVRETPKLGIPYGVLIHRP